MTLEICQLDFFAIFSGLQYQEGFPYREYDRNTNRIRAAREIDREILPKKNAKYFAFMDPKKERKLECRASKFNFESEQ
jgi:hypothetical protein